MTKPALAIVGPGTVGSAIARLACTAGYRELSIGGRSAEHAAATARAIGSDVRAATATEAVSGARLVLLTVRDGEIEALARSLAEAGAVAPGTVVAHCSGALSSEALASLRAVEGVALASFHPLQTFPNVERAVADLPGSYVFVEGDARAKPLLRTLADDLRLRYVEIETAAKPLYHASAVLACNAFTALMDAALVSLEAAGIERETAWPAIAPLVKSTLANIEALGTEAALTGPVRRGDDQTVRVHLDALAQARPELASLYRTLADWTVALARRGGDLDEAGAERVRAALRPPGKPG